MAEKTKSTPSTASSSEVVVSTAGGSLVPLGHLLQDPADHRQAGWVRVVEAHLLDPSLVPVGEQRPVDQGRAETAAAQDRESHAARCSVLAMVPMMGAFWRGDH